MAKKKARATRASSSSCGQAHKLFTILMFIFALLWVGESFAWWALGWPYFPLIVLVLSIGGLEKLHR